MVKINVTINIYKCVNKMYKNLSLSPLFCVQAVALHMTHVEFAKGLHTSGPLFLLWLLLLICGIVPFYTYIVEPDITVSIRHFTDYLHAFCNRDFENGLLF